MYRLRSGSLRERVQVQEYTESQSATGTITRSWSTVHTRWGSVRALSHDERLMHEQLEASAVYEVILRYYDEFDIDTSMRLLVNSVPLQIRSIDDDDPQNRLTRIIAVEEVL